MFRVRTRESTGLQAASRVGRAIAKPTTCCVARYRQWWVSQTARNDPAWLNGFAAFGAFVTLRRAAAQRIPACCTLAALDANPPDSPPHRPRNCEEHPHNRSVEDRVDREPGPDWTQRQN